MEDVMRPGRCTCRVEAPEKCVGYQFNDPLDRKIGRVERLFVNGKHEPEYVRVRIGLFGLRSVLIPVGFAVIDEERRTLTLK